MLAVIFLGGTVLVDALTGAMMPRAASAGELRGITRISRVNQYLGLSAAILIPIFGYATVNELDLSLDTGWLLIGQVLFWIAFVVAVTILMLGAFKMAKRASQLPDGPIPDDVMAELKKPLFPALGGLLTIFFVVIVCMMVA